MRRFDNVVSSLVVPKCSFVGNVHRCRFRERIFVASSEWEIKYRIGKNGKPVIAKDGVAIQQDATHIIHADKFKVVYLTPQSICVRQRQAQGAIPEEKASHFLPTDLGLTKKQKVFEAVYLPKTNEVHLLFDSDIHSKCVIPNKTKVIKLLEKSSKPMTATTKPQSK